MASWMGFVGRAVVAFCPARGFPALVARILNRLYRRLAACLASATPVLSNSPTPCRQQVGDTADSKSVLLDCKRVEHPGGSSVRALGRTILAGCLATGVTALAAAATPGPGLRVEFTRQQIGAQALKDVAVLPNLCLYVPNNSPPTPFVSAGPFTAVWSGFVSLDLRSEYRFQAELNGERKLELN